MLWIAPSETDTANCEGRSPRCEVRPVRQSQFVIRHCPARHDATGRFDFVLANGSMSSNQSGDCNARSARREWATNSQGFGSQRDIRRALIEADLVDCLGALPGQRSMATEKFNLALAA